MRQSRFPRFISAHLPSQIHHFSRAISFCIRLCSFHNQPVPQFYIRSCLIFKPYSFYLLSLRADADTLASLREKLSLLWGNLEERKSKSGKKSPSKQAEDTKSPSFECCLKEYGIRSRRRKKLLKEENDCRENDDNDDDDEDDGERAEGGAGEVGDRTTGWERKWRLWGTTIS